VISENGLGAFDKLEEDKTIQDPYRIVYLREHIKELKKAIQEGCEILAYCTWSCTDLLSWLNGYQKRYGFIYVDREEEEHTGTLQRYKKDSFYWYQKVIKSNGEDLEE
ncbi:MAG: family 1 glycosylhydrolase, partial [Longicatena sp.]